MVVLLAALSGLIWGTADFVGGLMSRRRPAPAVVAGSQAVGLVGIGVVAVATQAWSAPAGWLPWAVASGLSGTVGLLCFYAALSSGTMGVVSSIAALGALVPVVLGVAGGERLTLTVSAGIGLAVAGAVAASGPEVTTVGMGRPVALAAVASLLFGVALTAIQRGSQYSAVMTLTGMRVVSVTIFVVGAGLLRTVGGLTPRDLAPLVYIGLGDVGANLMYAVATQRGLLSVTGALGSLYPVVTVVLARLVLHERLRRVQQLGVAAALTGVVLVSMG